MRQASLRVRRRPGAREFGGDPREPWAATGGCVALPGSSWKVAGSLRRASLGILKDLVMIVLPEIARD